MVDDHLFLLATALRSTVQISERLLWGNAASAPAGAARTLTCGPAGRTAQRLSGRVLGRGVLRGTGAWQGRPGPLFVRRSCCLYYGVPGGGICLDCVLDAASARRRRSPGGRGSSG